MHYSHRFGHTLGVVVRHDRDMSGSLRAVGCAELQVDSTGKAWVAGYTRSSLDGNRNSGGADCFLMTFDADGNHLWTRQHGGADFDWAQALQVDSGFSRRFWYVPVGNLIAGYSRKISR